MKRRTPSFTLRYLRLVALGILVSGASAVLGYYPTLRLGGGAAVDAMLAGCGVALLAGWIGAIPICVGTLADLGPAARVNRVLFSMALRMVTALAVTLSVVLSGWFSKVPLLIWIATAYLLTLLADTVYLVCILKVTQPPGKS